MESIVELFFDLKTEFDSKRQRNPGVVCKVGFYSGCSVLKLQKPAWTNDDIKMVPNRTGIFFSIWVDDEAAKKGTIKYNIHALKLRQLTGYKLTSRAFAAEFRDRFSKLQKSWPNVRIDYGPQTLMQGWIPRVDRTLTRDLLKLMNRFGDVSPIIDELLKERKRPK